VSILIVGGDRLGNIEKNLKREMGFTEIQHISGRKKRDLDRVSGNTDVVLVLTDFVGHELAGKIKERARAADSKTFFARRSWAHIKQTMDSVRCS
jgi:hypothetical protein